jgi:hypothetical protein
LGLPLIPMVFTNHDRLGKPEFYADIYEVADADPQ